MNYSANKQRTMEMLRKELDELGYRMPMDINSLPLIEKLFGDLVFSMENLKDYKTKLELVSKEKDNYQKVMGPYQHENAVLITNINSIVKDMEENKESTNLTIKDLKNQILKLDNENSDLRFLNTQFSEKIASLDKELEGKTQSFENAYKKSFHPKISASDVSSSSSSIARPYMVIQNPLPQGYMVNSCAQPPKDQQWIDVVQSYDARMAQIQENSGQILCTLEQAENAIRDLNTQLIARDSEISRLKGLLEDGRPIEAALGDLARGEKSNELSHLSQQLECLLRENTDLQKRLAEEQERTKGKASKGILKAKGVKPVPRKPEEKIDLEQKVQDLSETIKCLTTRIEGLNAEKSDASRKVTNLERDKCRLQANLSSYKRNERKLVEELDQISKELAQKPDLDTVSKLEAEKNTFQKEALNLRKIIAASQRESKSASNTKPPTESSKGVSQEEHDAIVRERNFYQEKFQECLEKNAHPSEPKELTEKIKELESQNAKALMVQQEFHYKLKTLEEENNILKKAKDELNVHYERAVKEIIGYRSSYNNDPALMQKIKVLEEENKAIQNQLTNSEYKHHLIDSQLKDLLKCTTEKDQASEDILDKLKTLIEGIASQEEKTQACFEIDPSNKDAQTQEEIINSLKEQLCCKDQNNVQLQEDFAKMRNRLCEVHNFLESQLADSARLQSSIQSLEQQNVDLQQTSLEAQNQVHTMQSAWHDSEESSSHMKITIKALESELSHIMAEIQSKNAEISRLNRLIEDMSNETQGISNRKDGTARHNKALVKEMSYLSVQNKTLSNLLEKARKEQDVFRIQIAEYIKRISSVENLFQRKESELKKMLEHLNELNRCNRSLQNQSHAMATEKNSAFHDISAKESELETCQTTIDALTCELDRHLQSEARYKEDIEIKNVSLGNLNAQVHMKEKEVSRLVGELEEMRSLDQTFRERCSSTETIVECQAATIKSLEENIKELQDQMRSLKNQEFDEKRKSADLECLLSKCKEKCFNTQRKLNISETERGFLRTRLEELDKKSKQQTEDIAIYAEKLSDFEMEVESLQRQMVNERYQRERASQELRIVQQEKDGRKGKRSKKHSKPEPSTKNESPFPPEDPLCLQETQSRIELSSIESAEIEHVPEDPNRKPPDSSQKKQSRNKLEPNGQDKPTTPKNQKTHSTPEKTQRTENSKQKATQTSIEDAGSSTLSTYTLSFLSSSEDS